MNLFILDSDPQQAAIYHCDQHVARCCFEYTQMLCTALRLRNIEHKGYQSSHKNHPSVQWASESLHNYAWLFNLALAIHGEYLHRFGNRHKALNVLSVLPVTAESVKKELGFVNEPFSFALVMPDRYRDTHSAIHSYRTYYRDEITKQIRMQYTNRKWPWFMATEVVDS